MSAQKTGWNIIESMTEFVALIADRPLTGDGVSFKIHSDGRISGRVGAEVLSGERYWENGYFCRTAWLDGESLGLDCEVIELLGEKMRYTRNMGRGDASIVTIGAR